MHTNLFTILCFFCQVKSKDIVYQRICLFLWLIFAQHGLFKVHLTVYSAISRLTDLGIYYITRCGIWLLTILHIPYIYFQRELRKVASPKWYLSFFFVQYITWSRSWSIRYIIIDCINRWKLSIIVLIYIYMHNDVESMQQILVHSDWLVALGDQ